MTFKGALRRIMLALPFAIAAAAPAQAASISSDIVFIVDESGSMGSVQANLRNNMSLFASILSGGGVDARYALVGYGDRGVAPRLITDFTNPTDFATAANGLRTNGGTEPGYSAIAFALNQLDGQTDTLSYRSAAVKNIIILTDEPSNGDGGYSIGGATVNEAGIDALLTQFNALLNGVLSGSRTIASYEDLIKDHSGNIFDLNQFGSSDQTQVELFVETFAKGKLQEIIDFCTVNPSDPACQTGGGSSGGSQVSEPGVLALLGLGLVGLAVARRRV
ncbi:vWA domain-containing protein [Futiania mangrovi]|uniref:VWA domain-containing protein n=1 Tax=Futiania mangrovi TaxID=2959716 RepID=A0A9J6PF72_9PROT|nr:vWA domain-containing protein [Futiania mangrovii]MCP1336443.1 VWA domain-containing protein [Futiania mangrovii]